MDKDAEINILKTQLLEKVSKEHLILISAINSHFPPILR